MAVRASREVVFEAPPEAIMEALADIDEVPTWSSLHKHAEVVDRHPDGRPRHVKATLRIMGITDKEVLEYHWGRDWMVWMPQTPFSSAASTVGTTSRAKATTRPGCVSTSFSTSPRRFPSS
jgi:uncharacterized protein YndB with AHSA1/START domain